MQLRTRVLITIVLSSVLLTTALVVGGWRLNSATTDEMASLNVNAKRALWRQIIGSQQESMESSAKALARDRTTTTALKERDVKTLKDSVDTTFNLLTASEVLNRLQIVDTSGAILYAAPAGMTGRTVKKSVYDALEKGEIRRGIERDEDGALVNTVVYPLYYRGKLIGAGVLESTLEPSMAAFKRNDHAEVIIAGAGGKTEHQTDEELTKALEFATPDLGETYFGSLKAKDRQFYETVVPVQNSKGTALAHLVVLNDATAYLVAKQRTVSILFAIAAGIVIALAIGFSYYIRRSFRPLEQSITLLGRIAQGDLTQKIQARGTDETGRLTAAMQQMNTSLHQTVGSITAAANHVHSASEEVKGTTSEIVSQIGNMNGETEQVAAAVHEMVATVREIARNANDAAQAAGKADQSSREGEKAVSSVGESIQGLAQQIQDAAAVVTQLSEDARGVTVVVDVIRGVAEQTNLLALNAAIEAARAGEHGRGFAVVADEVRTLASRTQSSTEEINQIVERLSQAASNAVRAMGASETTANLSVARAEEARTMLKQISKAVGEISDMNLQIASATEQQESVSQEISNNIERIRTAVAALDGHAQQTANAGQLTAEVAQNLNAAVSTFKL